TLGALDGELGDRRVVVGRAVEGRRDDLALDGTLHVRDFLGTFVDEDDHEVRFGVVLGVGFAVCCMIVVLPAFGGATMRPRWPLPMGVMRSIRRVECSFEVVSSRRRSCG